MTFSPARRGLILWALRRADLYLAETRRLVERAEELGLRGVGWYPNSRPMPRLPEAAAGNGRSCRRFVFLSQLYRAKGVVDLLDAAEDLPDGVTIDVYGTLGFDLPGTVFDGRRNVTYHGAAERDRVHDVLASHDALVLPTYYPAEGYPGVILEAYAAGIPVISTRTGAIPELVDESTGILVEPRDVGSLRAAMLSLVEEPGLCDRLRQGVRERRQEFSDDVWQERFVRYCRNVYDAAAQAQKR